MVMKEPLQSEHNEGLSANAGGSPRSSERAQGSCLLGACRRNAQGAGGPSSVPAAQAQPGFSGFPRPSAARASDEGISDIAHTVLNMFGHIPYHGVGTADLEQQAANTEMLMTKQPENMSEALEIIYGLRKKLSAIQQANVQDADDSRDCSLDSYFKTSLLGHLRQRLPWLMSLLLLESVSAYSLGRFQSMLNRHMTLAVFCPMIVGTAGNAGNQPGVIFTRALSMKQFNTDHTVVRFFRREFLLALIVSATMAGLAFARTSADHASDMLSCIAISIALFFVIMFAIGSGLSFSLMIHRCGGDPAAGAAPLLTTCSDVIGVLTLCIVSVVLFEASGKYYSF